MATDRNNEINILFEVSTAMASDVLLPLARACTRNSIRWACFFTGDGVKNLTKNEVKEMMSGAVKAVVCEASWELHMGDDSSPVELGSQTNNSTLVGSATRVVSL